MDGAYSTNFTLLNTWNIFDNKLYFHGHVNQIISHFIKVLGQFVAYPSPSHFLKV
jgi:hypothetical protein